MKALYRLFGSIRFTLLLTYLIVFLAVWGSLLLIRMPAPFHSIDKAVLIEWIGGSPLSASWWILLLVLLVFLFALNTLVCTWQRVALLLRARRGRREEGRDDEETLLSEDINKGRGIRFRTLLPYIAHIGFIIALAGHLAGSLWGFRGGEMEAGRGERMTVPGGGGYTIEVESLRMKVGRRGYPEEMSANVRLLSGESEVRRKEVEINRPLIFGPYALYIQNVQSVPRGLSLSFSGPMGESEAIQLSAGAEHPLPGGTHAIAGGRIDRTYGAMEVVVLEGGKPTGRQWLSPYDPRYRTLKVGEGILSAEEMLFDERGVFTVNKDPGTWIVFAGLFVFIASLALHLFMRR